MNLNYYNLLMSYIDAEISVIPVKMIKDKDDGIYYGKFPAIKEWQTYCERLPTDEEARQWSSIPNISGIAIVMGKASNLCCIDIDTEDPMLQKKIEQVIPYSRCLVKGNEKRLGKYIYRLFDTENEYINRPVGKEKVKKGKETVADILWENSYIVIPPSQYSNDGNGTIKSYEWGHEEILKIGKWNVPILTDEYIKDKIDMVVKGMTKKEISHNLPVGAIDLSSNTARIAEGHRHEDMVSYVAELIAKRTDPTTAIRELIHRDGIRNKGDEYFLDRSKGHKTDSIEINAIKFYTENVAQKARGKAVEEMELPTLGNQKLHLPVGVWGNITKGRSKETLPKFNSNWIPNEKIRDFISTASVATSVSPQNIFFYMLGGFSAVTGNKLMVKPYINNTRYKESCNLYMGIVASSGERKSATTSIAMKPLIKLNKHIKEINKKKNMESMQLTKDLEKKISHLNKLRDQAVVNREDFEKDDEEVSHYDEQIDKLKKLIPKQKRLSIYEQETTIQKLYEIAEENDTGLFVEFNEFGAKWEELQARGNEQEKRFYLDGWDGNRPFSYKTKHQGEVEIERLTLSTGFSIQNDVIEQLIHQITSGKVKNDGFIQRYLISVSDQTDIKVRDIDYQYPQELFSIFENAYYIEPSESYVNLTERASKVWQKFQEKINGKKALERDGSILEASLSKYVGLSLRIAINLEVFKNNGKKPDEVSEETIKTAIEIMEYFEGHLRYLLEVTKEKETDKIVSAFKTGAIEEETTVRDLYRQHQRLFGKDADETQRTLERLAKRNIIRVVKTGRSNVIKINPALFT